MTRTRPPALLGRIPDPLGPRRHKPADLALPQWFESGSNSYFCGLIARQLQLRSMAHRSVGAEAAAAEAETIAEMIRQGEFDWLK